MVELLCTFTGIVAGIAMVASLMQSKGDRRRWQAEASASDLQQQESMRSIADQLRMLTLRVAADVTLHNQTVEAINNRLNDSQDEPNDNVLLAINELLTANKAIQDHLVDARRRIADQSQLMEEATLVARSDALTGLANRQALNDFMKSCLNSMQPGECAGLMVLDIDEFKSFNENYGRPAGDAVLAAVARNLKKACNNECYPARFGGEEFAVILTATNPQALAEKAAALRSYVSEQLIVHEDLQLRITTSAGLCVLPAGGEPEASYDRADEGVYQAKKAGRNQGFWLSDGKWVPFPNVRETETPTAKSTNMESLIRQAQKEASPLRERSGVELLPATPVALAGLPVEPTTKSGSLTIESESQTRTPALPRIVEDREETSHPLLDVLDLSTFMNRAGVYLEQLSQTELPATGMLIQIQFAKELNASEAKANWDTLLDWMQVQFSGIDIICLYRPNTAGIFMPGSAAETALQRASAIQRILESHRGEWLPAGNCPDRLSIGIAQAKSSEDTVEFFERLELTLEAAQKTGSLEIAVHDGSATSIQAALPA